MSLNHRVTELNNISNDTLASDVKILKPKSTQFLIAESHFIHDEYVFCKEAFNASITSDLNCLLVETCMRHVHNTQWNLLQTKINCEKGVSEDIREKLQNASNNMF